MNTEKKSLVQYTHVVGLMGHVKPQDKTPCHLKLWNSFDHSIRVFRQVSGKMQQCFMKALNNDF